MYPLIRRYLRRVDVIYLLLCAACSAISIAVLVSIGQTQLGSNNKASVQLIASLLGLMLAAVFSTADYHALARAWPLHGVVAWGLVLPTLFLHNVNTGLVTIGYDAGGTSNYSWYRVGGMTFQPAELAKISFILTLALHLSQVRGQVNRPKNLLLLFDHRLNSCHNCLGSQLNFLIIVVCQSGKHALQVTGNDCCVYGIGIWHDGCYPSGTAGYSDAF